MTVMGAEVITPYHCWYPPSALLVMPKNACDAPQLPSPMTISC